MTRPTSSQRRHTEYTLETLEPRILLSGDSAALLGSAAVANAGQMSLTSAITPGEAPAATSSALVYDPSQGLTSIFGDAVDASTGATGSPSGERPAPGVAATASAAASASSVETSPATAPGSASSASTTPTASVT